MEKRANLMGRWIKKKTSLLGLLTFALEFVIPESIVYNMGFMFSLFGRGLCKLPPPQFFLCSCKCGHFLVKTLIYPLHTLLLHKPVYIR